jgi:ankyrin repeat protein
MSSNKYNEDNNIDLLFASYHGDLDEIADLFFKSIPNVNVKGKNNVTPLILASQQGNLDIVKVLLNSGARVDDIMTDGRTALLMACKNGHIEVVKLLLGRKANQFLKRNGISPRDIAKSNGHTEIVRILDLYKHNAEIPEKVRGGKRRKTIRRGKRKGKRRKTNKRKRT